MRGRGEQIFIPCGLGAVPRRGRDGMQVIWNTELIMATQKKFGVIFDLDGVIVSTDRYHRQAWQQLADELGLPFTDEQAQATRGVDRMSSLAVVLGEHAGEYTQEQKNELATRKNNVYKELIKQITPADALPGVDTLIPELRRRGIPCAIGSASKNATPVLESMGIADKFDAIVTGFDFVHGKPAPDVFLVAASRLGLDPAQCVVFEDAAAGIQAAHAGGMKAVGVGNPEIVKGCDKFAGSLAGITADEIAALFD